MIIKSKDAVAAVAVAPFTAAAPAASAAAVAAGAAGPSAAVAVRQVFDLELFTSFRDFTGGYKQHKQPRIATP